MAINNGRYVTTGGYMDANGNIIEEQQWVPNTTYDPDHIMSQVNSLLDGDKTPAQIRIEDGIYGNSPAGTRTVNIGNPNVTFSPAETYKFQADGYYNLGDTALGDAYSALWKGSNAYSNSAKQMNDFYSQLAKDVTAREGGLAGVKSGLAKELTDDIMSTKQYVMDMFGPNGVLTQEVNKYYDDLGNYLSSQAGRETAKIAAQGVHSGASLGAIRAQQNEAYNEVFERYIKAKEQEINAKQTIAGNLINYMSTLRKEYGDTTNQYIIEQYQRANDLLNNLSSSIASSNAELATAKLKAATSGSGTSLSSSSATPMTWQDYLAVQSYLDQIKSQGGDVNEAVKSIVETSDPNKNK